MAKTLFLSDTGAIDGQSLERRARIQTAILESNADAIIVGDDSGVVYANAAAKKLLGDGLLGNWYVLLADGSPCANDDLPMARAIRGIPFDGYELRLRRPGAAEVWVSASGRLLIDEGKPRGGVVTFRDVTEKKAIERRLLLSDRMAAIGTLAASIAHEINNPMTILLGNITLVMEGLEENEEKSELIRKLTNAHRSGGRVERIVADLRKLSSGSEERTPVDLADVIESTIALASKTVQARARVVRKITPAPRVFGNEPRLGQVVLNLLVNAAQAIPEGAPGHEIRVSLRPEVDLVALEVEDTGVGIPPETLPRIFEPFFTTKKAGEGTGLGLWITQGIVTSMGGEISVTSVPGRTTFRIVFPAHKGPGPEAPSGSSTERGPG